MQEKENKKETEQTAGKSPAAKKKSAAKSKEGKAKKTLVIVESPTKAANFSGFLKRDKEFSGKYEVLASKGHLIDLPKSRMGVDVDNNFEPDYITVRGQGKILNSIKKAAARAEKVLLATDDDREGEAIAYHIFVQLRKKFPDLPIERIKFNSTDSEVVKKSLNESHSLNYPLIEAQKARRVLDRLVGYSISPILWEKVKKGLSAGRVQSVALRLICEREREIREFKPEEYWHINVWLGYKKAVFEAALKNIADKMVVSPQAVSDDDEQERDKDDSKRTRQKSDTVILRNREQVEKIVADLKQGEYICENIEERTIQLRPKAPFKTSTLLQDASTRLNFKVEKTMRIAQQLYEGVELKDGLAGLITYMRTDSIRIAPEPLNKLRNYILDKWGEKYLAPEPLTHTKKKQQKGVQDAHEGIRPSDINRTPEQLKPYLSRDQYRLYNLIWSRFAASQMTPALRAQHTITVRNGEYLFRTTSSKITFKGYQKAYAATGKSKKQAALPDVKVGEKFVLLPPEELTEKVTVDEGEQIYNPQTGQHFTTPPARFNDKKLVDTMENAGIGRPGTYVPTIATLVNRYYITRQNKQFIPTELGFLINDLLVKHFPNHFEVGFTASMEDGLSEISDGERNWTELLTEFYRDFKPTVDRAAEEMENLKNHFDEPTEFVCEKCGKPLIKRLGRYGYFLACSGFPECRNTRPVPLAECPRDDCDGYIVAKRGGRGRLFYGCTNYKDDGTGCDYVTWDKPIEEKCPKCEKMMVEKKTKERGLINLCVNPECGYVRELDD